MPFDVENVDYARVRAVTEGLGRRLGQETRERVRARQEATLAAGGQLCRILTRTGEECGRDAVGVYLTGPCCEFHTPAATAGRPEPIPDPRLTMEGLRRRWYAERDLEYIPMTTPASGTVVDERAVASGKRRSSSTRYREAQQAVG